MAEFCDSSFQSDFYRSYCPLTVGVKPYLPGITIDRDHPFVSKMDEWANAHGKKPQDELTPPNIRDHPGNPIAVIEGSDKVDYVMTDKNRGGKDFADEYARKLAADLRWDLGEGVAASFGVPADYLADVIMVPTDGTRLGYRYDKSAYSNAYLRQSSAKVAKEQLPKSIKGNTLKGVVKEIMNSEMVVETIRQKMGYYNLSTNDRFENLSNEELSELLITDANHLSGTADISLSPLYVKNIRNPEFELKPDGGAVTWANFDYGYGKLFSDRNIHDKRVCKKSQFRKQGALRYFRRLGEGCQSFMSLGGTLALEDEKELEERDQILKDNQEFIIEKMTMRGKVPYEKSTTYPIGHFDLMHNKGIKEATPKAKVAHFQLYKKTRLDHKVVLPFVLVLEMFKSELIMYLALICIFYHQITNPQSCQFESGEMEPGERTVITYQRLVETMHPCAPWWGGGVIMSGERWKETSRWLFSRRPTFLASTLLNLTEVLGLAETDERTKEKWNKIKEELKSGQFHYLFLPIVESKNLTFTTDDRVFCTNNSRCILKENQVKELFDMRFERNKGPLPRTMVSSVVTLSAFERSKGDTKTSRMSVELQQPCTTLLKAETIRIFRIRSNKMGEQEPDYDVKIKGYVEAMRIEAFKDHELLSSNNIQEYMRRSNVPENEQADVIRHFEDEVAAKEERELEGGCEGTEGNANCDEPSAKKAKLGEDE